MRLRVRFIRNRDGLCHRFLPRQGGLDSSLYTSFDLVCLLSSSELCLDWVISNHSSIESLLLQ